MTKQFISIRNWEQLLAIPLWQAMLSLFLIITWLVAWVASLMRLRMQLYEMVLAYAMESKVLANEAAGEEEPAKRMTGFVVKDPPDVSGNH